MAAEFTVVLDSDNIVCIIRVVVSEVHKDVQFDASLMLKF